VPSLKPRKNDAKAGDIVKIRIHLKQGDHARWPELKQQAREWAQDLGLIADTILPVLTDLQQLNKDRTKHQLKRSDEQLLKDYAKARGVDDLTIKAGMRLL
jgi:flagellar basal body-associated protein FliL